MGWRFENGVYVRYQDGEPHQILSAVDAEPEPLTRETLVILMAHQKSAGYTDGNGVDVSTFDIVGGGDIFVFHNGEVVSGNWFRGGQAEAYVFTAEDGKVIPIPGDSRYLAVVPADALLNVG